MSDSASAPVSACDVSACTPGSPKIVSTPSRNRDPTSARPPSLAPAVVSLRSHVARPAGAMYPAKPVSRAACLVATAAQAAKAATGAVVDLGSGQVGVVAGTNPIERNAVA